MPSRAAGRRLLRDERPWPGCGWRGNGAPSAGTAVRGSRAESRCWRSASVQCSCSRWNTQRRHAVIVTSRPRELIEPMTATSASCRSHRKQQPWAHSNRPHNVLGFMLRLRRRRDEKGDRQCQASGRTCGSPDGARHGPGICASTPLRTRPLPPAASVAGCRPVPDGGQTRAGCRPGLLRDAPPRAAVRVLLKARHQAKTAQAPANLLI